MGSSIYCLRPRDLLVLCVLSLLLLGVLMVQSASMELKPGVAQLGWTTEAIKQIALGGLALVVFFVVGFFDYRRLVPNGKIGWRNPVILFYGVTAALCAATLVPFIGQRVNGARRWIDFGPFSLQTSELAKWAVVLLLVWALVYREEIRQKFGAFLMLCLATGFLCLLVVIEDFGTAALIGLTVLILMLVGRVRWWHLAAVVPPILAAGVWFIQHKEYRLRRMTSFWEPFRDPQGEGYHMVQSLLSFASGGVFGKGLGNGVQKLGYLPEDTTDFIFAVVCEELGLFGALLTIVLYLGIAFVGWTVIREIRDPLARLLVFGVTTVVCLQALINMAVATVSVPTKGMSLPLVSSGGSGLVITCAALGVVYAVARAAERQREPEELPLRAVAVA